ncbi:MAG TPA: TIR domain-containing protein [Rhizomicrobium sp.]|nr:TIR domain-containing protein [Rhizomicrobium sp.]
MAGEIFISYRRADEAWARLLHARLRAEGVEAWYDAQIGAGQDWRAATAKALQTSRIFVLLFSKAAAESEDIAKELAAATFSRKLVVPVRIENIDPTGAFLYELASRNWVNAFENTGAKLGELAQSLARLVKDGIADESIIPFDRNTGARAPAQQRGWPTVIAAAAIVVATVAAALFWLRPAPLPAQLAAARVAVLPFDTLSDGPGARHFADALTDEIATRLNSNRIQVVSRDDAATLRGPDRDRKIGELGIALLLDGTVQNDGKAVKVRVHLEDPARHATLWSGSVDGPAANSDQLQASVANTILAVLACSTRALAPAHGLTDPDLLSRYLHACDIFVRRDRSRESVYDLLASLREVAAKAPDFTPAHSDFARMALLFSSGTPADQAAPLRREAEAEAHKALALDPKSPDAHLALASLLPVTDWAGREKLLRQGLTGDPDWPFTNRLLGIMLADTGRLQDAAGHLQKAAAADQQVNWGPVNARLQCASGQFEPVTGELFAALKHNPGDGDIGYGLRGCLKYAGRWADLRALARMPTMDPAMRNDPSSPVYDTYLVAEESGKPADVARARQAALAADSRDVVMANAIEALSVLGLTDDAFALANRYTPRSPDQPAFLFYTLTAPLRRDPRFMQLAARLKLVDYWKASGKWPDFCADPGLPYNCRAEANRFKPAK